MQVEVNEQNIILYHLVELTGNSAEDMLVMAREAEVNGYALSVEVPDEVAIHANTFEVFSGQPADASLGNDPHPLQHGIDDYIAQRRADIESGKVVIGEVVDTSHIPFPPDMVPYDDEEE